MRERELIDWIRAQTPLDPRAVPVGPGDDCAIVNIGRRQVLITTDQALDGVHFRLEEHGARAAGRKAMARGLSDIAAMAAVPVAAVASVAMPRGFPRADAEALYAGMREAADPFDCPIVGGDIGAWDGPLSVAVTVLGRRAGVTGGIEPVLRSGAKVGDAVCVTGKLGGAWRSRRHLQFVPRIPEAICLAMNYGVRAMIDLSDGLATDLGHVCLASGVAAEVAAADVPIHPDARERSADVEAALQSALCDGEDYELLFVLSPARARTLCRRQPLPVPVTRIGQIVRGHGVTLIRPDGRREELAQAGWEHRT